MPDPLAKPNRPKPNPLEGAALIIVLSCLVLLAALAIGLLNRVEADRTNASAYRGSTQTRNLAEYAINVVMAQISAATSGSNAVNTWASQPGAIRVYASKAASLVNIYKLYSSPNMVVNAFPSADTNLSGWTNNTALFTDLNAPVISGSGVTASTNYPILDPAATNSVEGFAITGAPETATQPAPMPVNWLYVLEDGTLSTASDAGNNTVTVTGASAANPIVGRIAFWTDDDTSKININTASGAPWNYTNTTVTTTWGGMLETRTPANFWDTPIIGSSQDINLALAQPWAAEYQRYPGHPASVSLSATFTNLTTNDIMAIAPRLTYQNNNTNVGSRWGSYVTENAPNAATFGTLIIVNPGIDLAFRIPDDASRLYANVDELLFATNRSATGTNPVTPQQLETARFFLTASSRAPDVTLFNTPRILSWPITFEPGNTTKITPYDRLIAFCGTVGDNTNYASTNSYYFTRFDPLSATKDYTANTRLLAYLRRMTTSAVPGFGGSAGILGKYGLGEAEQITTQIFDYIRCVNVRDMSMATSAADTQNQYSYVLSSNPNTTNSGGVVPTRGTNNTRGFGRFPTITKVGMHFWFNTYFRTTNGGVTNTNVSLCARLMVEPFYASHGHPSPQTTNTHRINVSGLSSLRWGTSDLNTTNIFTNNTASFTADNTGRPHGGRVAAESTANNASFIATSPFTTNNVTTTGNTTVNTPLPNPLVNSANTFSTNTNATFYFSGGDLTFTIRDASGTTHQEINVNLPPIPALPVPLDTTKVWRTNSDITDMRPSFDTFKEWATVGANGTYIRDGTFSGPNATLTASSGYTVTTFNGPLSWTANNTLRWTNQLSGDSLTVASRKTQFQNDKFHPEDVVRAVGTVHGDFRLIAANPNVATTNFATIDGGTNENAYYSSNSHQRLAHNFVGEYPYSMMGARFPHANYYISTNTTFTSGLTNSDIANYGPLTNASSVTNIMNWTTNAIYVRVSGDAARPTTTAVTGDFDNGYGAAGDGPYIGFADEGNARVFQFTYPDETSINFSVPYLDGSGSLLPVGAGFFSPNRLVPSAGIMGSLPTGVISQTPWQTLLFRPAALTSPDHPGLDNPPDYLLLDLFNMPVVEPYAISEPLSTAGRVNMNYQILPFTYIKRSTAVQAALHTEWLTAIPNGRISDQGRKTGGPGTSAPSRDARNSRWPLNLNTNTGTLRGFEDRFAGNDIFRSAAEICSIRLVPLTAPTTPNPIYSSMASWWRDYSLTGDNSKERPYARIYPKLTTKSNTYTVHYRVEVLKQSPNSPRQNTWADGTDKVISTYRGSTTIERYVNPRDPGLPDYANITTLPPTGANALPNFYKFRILAERQFNP